MYACMCNWVTLLYRRKKKSVGEITVDHNLKKEEKKKKKLQVRVLRTRLWDIFQAIGKSLLLIHL